MKDIKYKGYSFKLNEKTYKQLRKLKEKKNLSWNLLFLEMIKKYGTR